MQEWLLDCVPKPPKGLRPGDVVRVTSTRASFASARRHKQWSDLLCDVLAMTGELVAVSPRDPRELQLQSNEYDGYLPDLITNETRFVVWLLASDCEFDAGLTLAARAKMKSLATS